MCVLASTRCARCRHGNLNPAYPGSAARTASGSGLERVVVRYGDDFQDDSVNSCVNADDTMMARELWAITSAFNALVTT